MTKTRVESAAKPAPKKAEPTAVELARTIDDAVALYQAKFPDDWEQCRLYPVQHALPHISAKLRSLG